MSAEEEVLAAAKASKSDIEKEVALLLELKVAYKEVTKKDYAPPQQAITAKKEKKESAPEPSKVEVPVITEIPPLKFFPSNTGPQQLEDTKCLLIAAYANLPLQVCEKNELKVPVLDYPALYDPNNGVCLFGANAICRYLHWLKEKETATVTFDAAVEDYLNIDEFQLMPLLTAISKKGSLDVNSEEHTRLTAILSRFEKEKIVGSSEYLEFFLHTSVSAGLKSLSAADTSIAFPYLSSYLQKLASSDKVKLLSPNQPSKASKKAAKEKERKKEGGEKALSAPVADTSDVVKPTLPQIDWEATGLMSSLKILFDAAIAAAYPQVAGSDPSAVAVITRCANPTFGDFQCNNAMGLAKVLKSIENFSGSAAPRDVAARIVAALPDNPLVGEASPAPNGFVNIRVSVPMILGALSGMVAGSGLRPPTIKSKKVLVDFSSPNIAKEMHVGHLRSTIIGDCLCRVFEFVGFDVMRVNHVGDWGTQFGMLISYLQETFPDIEQNPPNISDLTVIYKASKARFDGDEVFKEKSRLNVVKLQSGDPACRAIWKLLCDISRSEFQKVYDVLDVKIDEFGESFYNSMIPELPHFTIPLMIRKSDGGYGYDSTDMAALKYRIHTLQRDWIVIITDAGQAPHFHMCYDAGRAAGWHKRPAEAGGDVRLDHIGFGVVANETVRLIDLLNMAKDRMKESLQSELLAAAEVVGYGAVKYFDLKQHPTTNYVFSYDRMLDTKGDTAVYLLFAYARLASILRKRALSFELLQFGDVLQQAILELMPKFLCDYLKELAVKFTDFVTKCHVLNAADERATLSRLLLCEATKRTMAQCFHLLGIGTLERI
eukprot:gene28257-37173_t